jgi:FkbM family methyltransferase
MRGLQRSRSGVHREADASWDQPSRLGAAGRVARAGLRRVTRPLTVRQRMVDDTLAAGLGELGELGALDALAGDLPAADEVTVVDTDVGRLLLHAGDTVMTPLIQRDRLWEAPEGRFLRAAIRPGATVLDVGANVGYMTLLAVCAAGPNGFVVAVEPEPGNLTLLRANLWLNGVRNARVLPVAAWSQRELLPLRFNTENRGDHQVGVEGPVGARLVPAAPLDELLGDLPVDVIKVDTQGVDHEAIAGLSQTLARNPDATVLAEFWLDGFAERGISPLEVLRGYRRAGLTIALLEDDGRARESSDTDIMRTCETSQVRFVNLVLRARRA